jgi:hypothetical protein
VANYPDVNGQRIPTCKVVPAAHPSWADVIGAKPPDDWYAPYTSKYVLLLAPACSRERDIAIEARPRVQGRALPARANGGSGA